MKNPKARTYDVLKKIDEYIMGYSDVLDKPRRKYMRDMVLGSIRSNSLILSHIAQKVQQITDKCANSHRHHLVSGLLRLNKRMILPFWLDSFSTDEIGFKSQNVEIMDVVESIFSVTGNRGILVYDSYLDIGHIFKDLLENHIRFVIRLKGNRMLNFQEGRAIVDDRMKTQKLRYSSLIAVKKPRVNGKKYWKLRYDYYPVTLPGRDDDQLYLVVAHREGKSEPIYLLTSVSISSSKDALRWIKGYFSRWGIEDTFRFWKQQFGLEDIRTTDIDNFKRLLWIAVVAFAFMTIHLLTDLKLRRELIGLTHRPRLAEKVAFLYYRLQQGLDKLFEVLSPEVLEANWET